MKAKYKYGIDLGTTNSSISLIMEDETLNKRAVTFKVAGQNGESMGKPREIIKTIVGVSSDGQYYVGDEALAKMVEGNEDNPIRNFKENLLRAKNDDYCNLEKKLLYSDVIAIILRKLKEKADAQNDGIKISGVVMGTPNAALNQTNEISGALKSIYLTALWKAGFFPSVEEAKNNTDFLYESLAVALYYGQFTDNQNKKSFIFDYGGGTMDVAIADLKTQSLNNGGYQVPHEIVDKDSRRGAGNLLTKMFFLNSFKKAYCDRSLGGSQDALRDMFEKAGLFFSQGMAWQVFWDNVLNDSPLGCEFIDSIDNLKIRLCQSQSGKALYDFKSKDGRLTFIPTVFSYRDFESSVEEKMKEIRALSSDMIKRNNLSKDDIDEVLLAGGSSLIPTFRKTLEELFGREKIHFLGSELDTLTCTSKGLAYYGYKDDFNYINDTTNHDYGFMDYLTGKILTILPRGVKLIDAAFHKNALRPYRYCLDIVQTKPDANYFFLDIYEGINKIKVLKFDKNPHSGSYRIFFCADAAKNELVIYVYDVDQNEWIDDLKIEERSYAFKDSKN